ncbi:MAG: protein-export chaperone SecB [Cellvibrionales bacterium]|nr:MAG: protein-export chaperone SecB [Cellvibrionales bacterium]
MDQEKTSVDGGNGRDQSGQTQLTINRVYVKDVSFEVPMGAEAFTRQWQPRVKQDVAIEVHKLADDQYEVELHITVAVQQDEQVLCVAEVQQAGIFLVTGVEPKQLAQILNTHCPAILFPYARELIDSLVVRGTFPALMLPPVNFEAIFQNAVMEKTQAAASSATDEQPDKNN